MELRSYTPEDQGACLAILESNTPRFFAVEDRAEFLLFLQAPIGEYSVLGDASGSLIGCGGISTRDEGREGILTWGMIHADYQQQGWGKFLVLARLRQLSALPDIQKVSIKTSSETLGFYSHIRFHTVAYLPHYYSEGLHRYDMELPIDDNTRQWLQQTASQRRQTK